MNQSVIAYPYSEIREEIDEGRSSTSFNTSFHSIKEAPDLPEPSELPYDMDRWGPMILATHGIPLSALQTVIISRSQTHLLRNAALAFAITGTITEAYKSKIREKVRPSFAGVVFSEYGLYMRFSACSARDNFQERKPLVSIDDIIRGLYMYNRALETLDRVLKVDSETQNQLTHGVGEKGIKIVFLPYEHMEWWPYSQYRVFCNPTQLKITAISQFNWHEPSILSGNNVQRWNTVIDGIWEAAERLRALILGSLTDNPLDMLFCEQGFTFDMTFSPSRPRFCKLIEVNVFGARSTCKSCLFHWINDRDVLYGNNGNVAEIRVTSSDLRVGFRL